MVDFTKIMPMAFTLGLLFFYHVGESQTAARSVSQHDTVSLLADRKFENGIRMEGANTSEPRQGNFLFPFGKSESQPKWSIAEWGTKHLVSNVAVPAQGEEIVFANKAKTIGFRKSKNEISVRLEVLAEHEYEAVRKNGEYWPHLLLAQTFEAPSLTDNLEMLKVKMDLRLLFSELKMPEPLFDNGLHSAQFQFFVTLQDVNPNSSGYDDFLWFGLPFYDYRYVDIPPYMAEDIGKSDASAKFIYMLGSNQVLKESLRSGQWQPVDIDILPSLKAAFKEAQARGFLKKSQWRDMKITTMNIGWESTATINSGVVVRNLDIQEIRKKK